MNKFALILTAVILSITLSACTGDKEEAPVDVPNETVETVESDAVMERIEDAVDETETNLEKQMSFNLEEINKHSKATDCWLVIDNKVYDVTEYIAGAKHPGGAALLEGCGLDDATFLFENKPGHDGEPHSDKARENLDQFFIGDLE